MSQIDLDLLLYLNHAAVAHPYLVKLLKFLGENPLPRGMPVFATLIYLWFVSWDAKTRCRIIVGILATSAALALSLLCQYGLPVHLRPIFDPAVDVTNILHWDMGRFHKRYYSFPSDTATLYFGLAATVFTINKRAGIANYAWCFLTSGICRVALGVHYPSDIIGGIVISSLAVLLANRLRFLRQSIFVVTKTFDRDYQITNMAFVLFVLEAYTVFPGVQALLSNAMELVR